MVLLSCACCSWCCEPIFTSWVYEVATKVAVIFRSLLLYYLPNTM